MLIAGLLLMTCAVFAQVGPGDKFPPFSGETLDDKEITLPEEEGAKNTVILIAYTADAQKDASLWVKKLYADLIDPNSMSSGLYDADVYFVYMFGGLKKVAIGKIKKKVKPKTDADLYAHTVIAESTSGWYKEHLNFKDKNQPNLYVVGPDGKIIHHEYGRFTSTKMDKVLDALAN